MAGELLVRVLKLDDYEKVVASGPIVEDMENTLFLDAGNWNLSEFSGPGWALLDNGDFTDAAPDVIDSVFELPLLDGFVCEEACPMQVTDEVLEIWYIKLAELLTKSNEIPVVREIAKALYGLVELVRRDKRLRLTVQGLL